MIITKDDNLKKHEGKRVCEEVDTFYLDLDVDNIFTKRDCKHLENQVLWSAHQYAPTIYQQLLRGLQCDSTRMGVQSSTLFQVLSHGRPMVDYCKC